MKRRFLIRLGVLFPCLAWTQRRTQAGSTVEVDLSELEGDLLNGRIARVEIFHFGYFTPTRARLYPELFEGHARNAGKVAVPDVTPEFAEGLIRALRNARPRPIVADLDLRWGAVFYDAQGSRRHTIYLDNKNFQQLAAQGTINGSINSVVVQMTGSLLSWFETNFSNLMGRSDSLTP